MPLEGKTKIQHANLRLFPSEYCAHHLDLHCSTGSPAPFLSTLFNDIHT